MIYFPYGDIRADGLLLLMIDGWIAGQSEREGGKLWRRAAAPAPGVRSSHKTERVDPGMVWYVMVWRGRYGMCGSVAPLVGRA